MEEISSEMIDWLKREVEDKIGFAMRSPSNFSELTDKVKKATGEALSLSTVKRLWGYVSGPKHHRISTLSILSRYLGFRDWDNFCEEKKAYITPNSGFINNENQQITHLNVGDELELEWEPERYCRIRCEGNELFSVTMAINCKLEIGDKFRASFIAVGHPLYVSDLMRGEASLQNYVAGKKQGLKRVSLKTKK